MTMWGADVAELERLTRLLDRKADEIGAARIALGRQLHSAKWTGPSAERFRHTWDGSHNAALRSAQSSLHTMATTLRRQADEQRRASESQGGAAGGNGNRPWRPTVDGGGVRPLTGSFRNFMWRWARAVPGVGTGIAIGTLIWHGTMGLRDTLHFEFDRIFRGRERLDVEARQQRHYRAVLREAIDLFVGKRNPAIGLADMPLALSDYFFGTDTDDWLSVGSRIVGSGE